MPRRKRDLQTLSANMSGDLVLIEPSDDVYKYRITLPEWMVEPGQCVE